MPKQRVFRFDPRIQLICEWEGCTKVNFEDNVELYRSHIRAHADRELRATKLEQLSCLWSGCGEETFTSTDKFKLHSYYHSFHMKLMSYGLICIQDLSQKFGRELECSNDKTTRTVLPELPDRFVCCWNDCDTVLLEAESFFAHVTAHADKDTHVVQQSAGSEQEFYVKCGWSECQYEGKTRSQLRVHIRSHTSEKEIACPTCGFMFCDRQKFQDHILRQVRLKPEDLNSQTACGSESTSSSPLKKSKSCGEPQQCDVCQQLFLTTRLLEEHRRTHSVTCVCTECGFLASGSDVLTKHIAYRHSDERPFPCQFCESKFKFRRDLRKHLFVHNSDSSFLCSLCSFAARTADTLNAHVRKVHRNEKIVFQCHICQSECSRGNNLSRHLSTVHGLTPPPGTVKFKYAQDPSDQIYRFVDTRADKVLPEQSASR